MMKRILLMGICLVLCLSAFGCKKQQESASAKENSGGSGYGVAQKSIITLSDLYFFSVNTTKDQVLAALGSPQKYTIAQGGEVTYLLESGASLKLTYSERETIKKATYIDESGKDSDLFEYLADKKVLQSPGGVSQSQNTGEGPQNSSNGSDQESDKKPQQKPSAENGYFSAERYSTDIASKLLKAGEKRQKILSALGKPNGYSSVSFAKQSYLIDAYYMEDGSIYYLDYGYAREKLRAVRSVKGGKISAVLGSWGAEKRPKDFYYITRNLSLFTSLKKGSKPSELYRRFGAPDWYEGNASNYRDAYQLMGGAVLYLDFGAGHATLQSASVQQSDGKIVPFALR